ncbi:MAG: hypothetical protein AABY11_00525 [archaeon]
MIETKNSLEEITKRAVIYLTTSIYSTIPTIYFKCLASSMENESYESLDIPTIFTATLPLSLVYAGCGFLLGKALVDPNTYKSNLQ